MILRILRWQHVSYLQTNYQFCDWLLVKSLRQNVSKYFIGMFYVVSDRYSTEHRGGENWTQKYTHFWSFFVKVTLKNVKITRDFRFFIKIQSEMKFLWSDSSSYASITKNIEDPIIMIHLLNFNQNWISVNFWCQK